RAGIATIPARWWIGVGWLRLRRQEACMTKDMRGVRAVPGVVRTITRGPFTCLLLAALAAVGTGCRHHHSHDTDDPYTYQAPPPRSADQSPDQSADAGRGNAVDH